mmetsp:Transcript_69494/g.122902  ORF Transcript_69494/g.122902 Transcript_69494/m.122902 type:complete len:141 (+) Transcript_69494:56-478(+)
MDGMLMEDDALQPISHLSETDQFMIMLNVCAAACGGFIYCLLTMRQRQTAGQRGGYFAGPFVSLGEASQAWKVYRQCSSKSERDMHVCNFCGFAIKASPAEIPNAAAAPARQELLAEDPKSKDAKEGLKQRKIGKKGKKT